MVLNNIAKKLHLWGLRIYLRSLTQEFKKVQGEPNRVNVRHFLTLDFQLFLQLGRMSTSEFQTNCFTFHRIFEFLTLFLNSTIFEVTLFIEKILYSVSLSTSLIITYILRLIISCFHRFMEEIIPILIPILIPYNYRQSSAMDDASSLFKCLSLTCFDISV